MTSGNAARRAQATSQRIVEAQQEERRAIAAELHEEALQLLTVALLKLSVLSKTTDDPEIEEIQQMIRRSGSAIRFLTSTLAPRAQEEGLGPALDELIQALDKHRGLKVDFQQAASERLPAPVEIVGFDSVRLVLNRFARAGGKRASLCVHVTPQALRLLMELSGPRKHRNETALRLESVGERLSSVQGEAEIELGSSLTTVVIELPLEPETT